jgi:two-component system invasion response regulator UvrY
MNNRIKVGIADDHTLFRKGLIKLLNQDRYELLFDVEDGSKVVDQLEKKDAAIPDIIIMDLQMRGMNGYETVSWLKENHPQIKVLVVSMVDSDDMVVRMLKLGVKGYLSKEMEPEDLHAALDSIMRKNYYYTDFITNKLVHSIQNEDETTKGSKHEMHLPHKLWNSLSTKQKEFLRYACTEMVYEEIADKMCVSPRTIDGYRDVVFERFNTKSRIGLVLYAIRNKLVSI